MYVCRRSAEPVYASDIAYGNYLRSLEPLYKKRKLEISFLVPMGDVSKFSPLIAVSGFVTNAWQWWLCTWSLVCRQASADVRKLKYDYMRLPHKLDLHLHGIPNHWHSIPLQVRELTIGELWFNSTTLPKRRNSPFYLFTAESIKVAHVSGEKYNHGVINYVLHLLNPNALKSADFKGLRGLVDADVSGLYFFPNIESVEVIDSYIGRRTLEMFQNKTQLRYLNIACTQMPMLMIKGSNLLLLPPSLRRLNIAGRSMTITRQELQELSHIEEWTLQLAEPVPEGVWVNPFTQGVVIDNNDLPLLANKKLCLWHRADK